MRAGADDSSADLPGLRQVLCHPGEAGVDEDVGQSPDLLLGDGLGDRGVEGEAPVPGDRQTFGEGCAGRDFSDRVVVGAVVDDPLLEGILPHHLGDVVAVPVDFRGLVHNYPFLSSSRKFLQSTSYRFR